MEWDRTNTRARINDSDGRSSVRLVIEEENLSEERTFSTAAVEGPSKSSRTEEKH